MRFSTRYLMPPAIVLIALIVPVGTGWYEITHTRVWDMTMLGNFPFDQDKGKTSDIPLMLRLLDSRPITVDGDMIPMDQAEKIGAFALLNYPWGGGSLPPPLQQVLIVRLQNGTTIAYSGERVRVHGTLHVGIECEEGYIIDVFRLDAASVEAAPWIDPHSRTEHPAFGGSDFILATAAGIGIPFYIRRAGQWWRAKRRMRRGRCVRCGYDLRTTPGRCPECGTIALSNSAAFHSVAG